MRSAKSTGRIIGMLMFVQLVVLALGFILLVPITTPAFLENAAGISGQIRLAVLVLLAGGALTIGIAIAGFPVFREYSYGMALSFLAVSIIWFSMQAVDNVHIMSMVSLSQQYAQGGGGASNPELFGVLAAAVRSTRAWAHNTELLVIDAWFIVLYAMLFRFSLVPRAVAGFALVMVLIHTAAIPLPVFVGYDRVLVLAYAMPLGQLSVGTWLLVRGFSERKQPAGFSGLPKVSAGERDRSRETP